MLKKIPQSKTLLIAVIVIVVLASYIAYQKYLVAATVNGNPISRLRVIAELEKQGGKGVLDMFIIQKLIDEQAEKNNISVSKDDIDKELKRIEANIGSQSGTLDEILKQQGMTRDELRKELEMQIRLNKLAKTDIIKITDKDVESYMKKNKDLFPADSRDKPDTKQIKEQLKQQKIDSSIQEYIENLRSKAKINYFGSYKQ